MKLRLAEDGFIGDKLKWKESIVLKIYIIGKIKKLRHTSEKAGRYPLK